MKINLSVFVGLLLIAGSSVSAQSFEEFSIRIEEQVINEFPGIHSFVFGTHDDYWVIMGGRIDGLHDHRPPFSFDEPGENNNIYVISPISNEVWYTANDDLPISIREQVGSSNMEFIQIDSNLIIVGGYGYNSAVSDHITFPNLTVVNLPLLIEQIIADENISSSFTQIEDERMAVTGGHLGRNGETLLLAMGQKFDGRYNPHNGPSFIQEYTNSIRTFTLNLTASPPVIEAYNAITDEDVLHRRDYNMHPQYDVEGNLFHTGFSGVFQYDADLPWLDLVHFGVDWYELDTMHLQLLNQYHTASLPIYSEEPYAMHTLFFGGIGMYYYEDGTLFIDSLVPFTSNVSRMTRTADNILEYNMPVEMPGLLGASAEFIPAPSAPYSNDGILLFNELNDDELLVGYVVGGIESDNRNIFMLGGNSWASDKIFKVYIDKTGSLDINDNKLDSGWSIFPNPAKDKITLTFLNQNSNSLSCALYSADGVLQLEQTIAEGQESTVINLPNNITSGNYYLQCKSSTETYTTKLVVL